MLPGKLKKLRERFFPIYRSEAKKFVPLLFIKLCLSFAYTVLHATKDTLIVTAKGSGAETIPILKGWFVLFFAFLFLLIYSKVSNHLSKSSLFYCTFLPFIFFFALYGFVLYPNRDLLIPHQSADRLLSFLGPERTHWVAVYRYWMDSIFFLMAELWGGVVIALSFWGFANRINSHSEASRFYTLFSAGGHVGVIIAGPLIWHFARINSEFSLTIKYLTGTIVLICFLVMAIFWWMDRTIIKTNEAFSKEKRPNLSLKDSLKHLIRSPSLGCIALMVIGYSISVNMIEVIWKATLKLQYPTPHEYEAFMGLLTSVIGALSLFLALGGGYIIRKFGWYVGALSTPIVLGCASILFLTVFFSNIQGSGALSFLIFIGAVHNISCKSMKYCLFDPTREMAYISLDTEIQVKGKAAIDVVASRFGKSGSSWLQTLFMELAGVSSVLSIAPFLTPIVLAAVLCWIIAISYLHQKRLQSQTN